MFGLSTPADRELRTLNQKLAKLLNAYRIARRAISDDGKRSSVGGSRFAAPAAVVECSEASDSGGAGSENGGAGDDGGGSEGGEGGEDSESEPPRRRASRLGPIAPLVAFLAPSILLAFGFPELSWALGPICAIALSVARFKSLFGRVFLPMVLLLVFVLASLMPVWPEVFRTLAAGCTIGVFAYVLAEELAPWLHPAVQGH